MASATALGARAAGPERACAFSLPEGGSHSSSSLSALLLAVLSASFFLPPKGRRFNKQASPKPLTKLSSTHLLSLSCPMMSYYPAIAMTSGGTILLPQGCSVGICSVSRVYA